MGRRKRKACWNMTGAFYLVYEQAESWTLFQHPVFFYCLQILDLGFPLSVLFWSPPASEKNISALFPSSYFLSAHCHIKVGFLAGAGPFCVGFARSARACVGFLPSPSKLDIISAVRFLNQGTSLDLELFPGGCTLANQEGESCSICPENLIKLEFWYCLIKH